MKARILNILINPIFLALVISLIIIWFLPPIFEEYQAVLINKSKNSIIHKFYYADLDLDGNSEELRFQESNIFDPALLIYSKGKIIDQWNFPGKYSLNFKANTGDYDNNGKKEIVFATINNDSIFLNIIDPFSSKTQEIQRFVSICKPEKGKGFFKMIFAGFNDLNQDGYKEVIFAISTGFLKQPRNLYAYDILNDILHKSPESCVPSDDLILFDFDKDGIVEIVGTQAAYGNCTEDFPYSDQFSWLMVFNSHMNFKFDPIKIGSYPARHQTHPMVIDNESFLLVLNINSGLEGKPSSLQLYDINGQLLKDKTPTNIEISEYSYIMTKSESDYANPYLIVNNGNCYEIDSELEMHYVTNIGGLIRGIPRVIDADNDKNNELLFITEDYNIIIVRNDFQSPVKLNIPVNGLLCYSTILEKNKPPILYLQFEDYIYKFEYGENNLYPLKYLIYLLIFGLILGFILIIQKAQEYRTKQRLAKEKQLIELQLKIVKNQLDPHFTLNLIASIGDLFDKKDHKQASYVFSKYSTLLRQSLLSSDQFTISLKEELDFVENYLSLERFRYDHKFDFKIDSNSEVEKMGVPKMLVHSFVENAVKHGVKHLEKDGKIEIGVRVVDKKYEITVKDNGIGRKKSKQIAILSTGKGISIVDRIIKHYNQLTKTNISYHIDDLYDDNKALGTLVIISIPI